MQFCSECDNMYYMRLSSENGVSSTSDKLEFYCRNCGHEDSTLTNENIICVSEYQTQSSDMKLKNMINKLYFEKTSDLKKYIRDTLKENLKETYSSFSVENILLEMFSDPEYSKHRVYLEIMEFQKK